MKKAALGFFDNKNKLHIENDAYRKCLHGLFQWLLNSDHVDADRTNTLLFVKKSIKQMYAQIVMKQDGMVAGTEEITYLVETFTPLQVHIKKLDGTLLKKGDVVANLSGKPEDILIYERTILNVLQRMTGIATETNLLVSMIQDLSFKRCPAIAATRKTPWGLLDKKAVAVGGGLTHRLTLSDGILVKDNHLLLLQKAYGLTTEQTAVRKALAILLPQVTNTLIEIEVEQKESIPLLLETFLEEQRTNYLGILLDNFTPAQAKEIIKEIRSNKANKNIIFEASGGITEQTITQWATTGVDILSLGTLTHSAKAADISLEKLV